MVVHERIKRAEAEDELREARQEKDALRSALTLLEGENGRLRIVEEDVDRRKIEGRRAIDLRPTEEEVKRRSAIQIRDLDVIPQRAGLSRSTSAYELGTKVPLKLEDQEQGVHPPLHSKPGPHSQPTDDAPEQTLEEAMAVFLSPPEPNFKPSTPSGYLSEEPSPWA